MSLMLHMPPTPSPVRSFDTETRTWQQLPSSGAVAGRGGSTLVASADGSCLFVIGGFCGHELGDVHVFDLAKQQWRCAAAGSAGAEETGEPEGAGGMRADGGCCGSSAGGERPAPRSVFGAGVHAGCSGGDGCSHAGHVLVFGGEVDPSSEGHAGAGCFSCEAWCLEPAGLSWHRVEAQGGGGGAQGGGEGEAPCARGWFASCAVAGALVVHGGLNIANERLGDMYQLVVE